VTGTVAAERLRTATVEGIATVCWGTTNAWDEVHTQEAMVYKLEVVGDTVLTGVVAGLHFDETLMDGLATRRRAL
jgi:hypothetical protein